MHSDNAILHAVSARAHWVLVPVDSDPALPDDAMAATANGNGAVRAARLAALAASDPKDEKSVADMTEVRVGGQQGAVRVWRVLEL